MIQFLFLDIQKKFKKMEKVENSVEANQIQTSDQKEPFTSQLNSFLTPEPEKRQVSFSVFLFHCSIKDAESCLY
jgi:hypothetical protein